MPLCFIAVILHNLIGICSAYVISKQFNYDEKTCRTIAVEVGMQNSGLGVALATQFYSSLAALPGAVFKLMRTTYLVPCWQVIGLKTRLSR